MSASDNPDPETVKTLETAREALLAGDKFAQEKEPNLPRAISRYDEAISCLATLSGRIPGQGIYLLAGAHMNKGNICAAMNSADATKQAIASYELAVDCFRRLGSSSGNERFQTDFVALWSNLAQVKIRLQTREGVVAATQCYENAIEILGTLAWESNDGYRTNLIGLWLNLGNTRQMLRERPYRVAALEAYDRATELAIDLPLDNPRSSALVATLWLNRGNALKSAGDKEALEKALDSYAAAIAILEKMDTDSNRQLAVTLGNALANKALILAADRERTDRLPDAVATATKALGAVSSDERQHPVPAEVALNARQALCQAACLQLSSATGEQAETHYQTATDLIDDCLELIRFWEGKKVSGFRGIARRLFRLGTQLYAVQQPHFLAEFVLDNLCPNGEPGPLSVVKENVATGEQALRDAIEALDQRVANLPAEQQSAALQLKGELAQAHEKTEQLIQQG